MKRSALTLMELLVVLAVLVALAAIVVPLLTNVADDSRVQVTRESLRQLQELLQNRYRIDMQGVVTTTDPLVLAGLPGPDANHLQPAARQLTPQLVFLFVNPATYDTQTTFSPVVGRGWRGPYLLPGRAGSYPGRTPATAVSRGFDERFGQPGDETVLDGWGNPIIIQFIIQQGTLYPELVSAGPDGQLGTAADNLVYALR